MTALKQRWVQIFLVFSLLLASTSFIHAQDGLNIGSSYKSADGEITNGDIVSRVEFSQHEVVRSQKVFDEKMLGVVSSDPKIVYRLDGDDILVIESGEAIVNVTNINGPINPGDAITSSPVPGKGQKSEITGGYILGTALTGFSAGEGTAIDFNDQQLVQGQIRINVNIGTGISPEAGVISRLVDQIGLLILRNTQTPREAQIFVRYLTAGLLAAIAIFVSFYSFGRNIAKGLEAVGRNPLAKTQIQAMIILNIVLIAIISIGGIVLSLAIIRF